MFKNDLIMKMFNVKNYIKMYNYFKCFNYN